MIKIKINLIYLFLKAMFNFRRRSCDYNIYEELLWEQRDRDVTFELLIMPSCSHMTVIESY